MKQIKSYPEKSPTTGESQVERSSQKAPSHLCRPTRHHSSTQTHPDSPACCLDQPAKSRQSSLPSVLPAIPCPKACLMGDRKGEWPQRRA